MNGKRIIQKLKNHALLKLLFNIKQIRCIKNGDKRGQGDQE